MIRYINGDGTSLQEAIKIVGAKNEQEGIDAEYSIIEKLNCTVLGQTLIHEGDFSYDKLDLEDKDGNTMEIWFDITEFYGRL